MGKVCSVCRLNEAVRQVPTMNGRSKRWKCQTCIDRKSVSFIRLGAKKNADKR
jgi:hypothetical protein